MRWWFFCVKELRRLPEEVERDNPDLTVATMMRCFALREIENKAMDEVRNAD